MSSTIKIPAMPEPLAYWFRHINTDGEPTTQWKPVEPRNPHMNTVHDSVTELLAYRYQDKPCYEVSAVHTADQIAARDAQWQESMKALVLHLQDAISACNSVSTCLDRKVTREGCVMYLQTEEWCKWLEEELQPQFRAALSAITEE